MALNGSHYIIMSASAGTGKDTVAKHIFHEWLAPIEKVITTTTRAPRKNNGIMEEDGVDYDFLSVDEFKARLEQWAFIEHAEYNGRFYGTPWHRVEQIIAKWKIPLSIVEVQGAANIMKSVRDRIEVLSIFLTLEPKELEARLRGRWGMTEADIQWRLAEAEKERKFIGQYDLRIENTDSRETAKIIAQITSDMIIWRTREEICKIYNVFGEVLN